MRVGVLVLLAGCGGTGAGEAYRPSPAPALGPGRHLVRFAGAVDTASVGARWRGPGLDASILAPMTRTPVILKADDFSGAFEPAFARYLWILAKHRLPTTVGLIVQRTEGAPAEDLALLASLPPERFEVWFHGWDHEIGPQRSEFHQSGLQHQREHFRLGLARAEALGLRLRSFGAPGNAVDADTARVLEEHPQIETVFYAPDGPRHRYRRSLDFERPAGVMRCAADVAAAHAALRDRAEPLAIQLHPRGWDDSEFGEFEEALDALVAGGHFFTTAVAHRAWIADRDRVVVTKRGPSDYEVDLSAATAPHALAFVAEPESIEEIR